MNNISEVLVNLKQALNDESTVLFIGSGVSVWSGLPRWDKLLLDLADIIESKGYDASAVRKNVDAQPLMAASYGTRYLTDEEFAEFIKKECGFEKAKPHKIHQLITKLGPTCYVTTNYDHLLEQALQKYNRKMNYKKILNNQPLDCSGILPVKEKGYIFKLHGDIEAPETIVLNNEQYEAQYSSGNRIYASRTLENILLTRTVIFIGYGLKDPDFLQIIAKIKNEFRVSSCPHYALVADCSSVEREFWQEQYNIRLVSFDGKTQGGYDYSKLLAFLENLSSSEMDRRMIRPERPKNFTRQQQTSIERYINSLIHSVEYEMEEDIFPLRIKIEKYSRSIILSTNEIIAKVPEHSFVLTGGPGAGKSFFLKQYCRQVALSYRQYPGSSSKKKSKLKIPIYIDLKSYDGRGSIFTQIAEKFPDNVPVAQWLEEGRFILFIDSYNEVPDYYRENKTCLYEINRYTYRNIVIIGDRTGESFEYHYHKYQLLSIEEEYIEEYLFKKGISFKINKEAVLTLLEKPLFFLLLKQKKIQVNDSTTPRSLYNNYFEYLNGEFQSKYQKPFNIKEALLPFAYDLVISGSEGFTVDDFIAHLQEYAILYNINLAPMGIINWLIEEQQFLFPLNGALLSFFHQSITEFLAGNYLAFQYLKNNEILIEHLEFRRLDFVLMYATEFLPSYEARQYINTILDKDMFLAMKACTYLEKDAEKTVELVLEYINEHIFSRSFNYWLEFNEMDIPVTVYHETILRKIMQDKDIIGGKAAVWLIEVFESSIIEEMLEEMFANMGCYNYLSAIANKLSSYITPQLFQKVMDRIGSIAHSLDQDKGDFLSPFSDLANELPLEAIEQYLSDKDYNALTWQQKKIILWVIYEDESQEALDWALSKFNSGEYDFAFSLYMKINFSSGEYDLCQIDVTVLNTLKKLLGDTAVNNSNKKWGISLLYSAYQCCPGFAKEVRAILKGSEGLFRLAVLYAIGKNRTNTFFREFSSILYWDRMPTEIIGAFELINWGKDSGHTDHIIEILIEKYPIDALSTFLANTLEDSYLYSPSLDTFLKLMTYIQKVCKWNDIINEYNDIGIFLSKHMHSDTLLDFYKVTTAKIKRFFNFFVLNRMESLELSSFTKKEINELLHELAKIDYELLPPDNFVLSNIATEAFVEERLLPLMSTKNSLLRKNLTIVIENIERQLGRRYLHNASFSISE